MTPADIAALRAENAERRRKRIAATPKPGCELPSQEAYMEYAALFRIDPVEDRIDQLLDALEENNKWFQDNAANLATHGIGGFRFGKY